MKAKILFVVLFLFSITARAEDGFKNETEFGMVLTSGNTQNETYNANQTDTYGWDRNLLKFTGRYLKGRSKDVNTARYWLLGLRYDRTVSDRFSLFAGYAIDSDVFAGFDPRHSIDVGGRYLLVKSDEFTWGSELGYRYMSEHQTATGVTKNTHRARAYSDATYNWKEAMVAKLWLEYLPNLAAFDDYMINGELSLSAILSEHFSLKSAYLVRYRNLPASPTAVPTDKLFTTALVAKF